MLPRPVPLLRRLVRRAGFGLERFEPLVDPHLRRQRALEAHGIELVVDGGANRGQYASTLRAYGYGGRVLSLEPGDAAFEALEGAPCQDPLWRVRRAALGAASGRARLALTANSVSSTLARPLAAMEAIPGSEVIAHEEVELTTPAEVLDACDEGGSPTLVKLDVQGNEQDALRGAADRLASCRLLELELAFTPLYPGQPTAAELMAWLADRGVRPLGMAPDTLDPGTDHLLEVDALSAGERR